MIEPHPKDGRNINGLHGVELGHMSRAIRYWDGAAALVVLIILLKAAILLLRGGVYGRLALPPLYDDVTYFVDALERIATFKTGGVHELIGGLVHSPPHSPYATFGAFFGFLISGNSTIAPYAFNAIALAALTILLLVLFEVRQWLAVVIAVAMTATAWFDNAITVYHPDLIAGYATAIIAAVAVFQRQLLKNDWKTVLIGIVAGFALLVKPTAFPAILLVWSLAFVFGSIASLADKEAIGSILRRLVILIICVALVAGPYFALRLTYIVQYITQAFFTDGDAWNKLYLSRDGQADRFGFYVQQIYGLFRGVSLVACALLVICLMAAICRRQLPQVIELLGLFILAVVTYIIPTAAPVKLMLFGALLYGSVIVAFCILSNLVWCEVEAINTGEVAFRKINMLGAALIWSLATGADMRDGQGRFPPVLLRDGPIIYDRIYSAITQSKLAAVAASHGISIFFPTAGPLPPHVFRFRGLKEGLNIEVTTTPLETDVGRLQAAAHMAKLIFIPDEPLTKTLSPYPVNKILGELTQRLRSDNSFKERASVDLFDGRMLIFQNDG
jgi:hypothetical protein